MGRWLLPANWGCFRSAKQTRKVRGWLLAAEVAAIAIAAAILARYGCWWMWLAPFSAHAALSQVRG